MALKAHFVPVLSISTSQKGFVVTLVAEENIVFGPNNAGIFGAGKIMFEVEGYHGLGRGVFSFWGMIYPERQGKVVKTFSPFW